MGRVGIIALCLALIAGNAQAGFLDGNQLYQFCTASDDLSQMQCLGYVEGVADYLNLISAENHRPLCVPVLATGRQVVDVVLNYLRDQPQNRTYDAELLVATALATAWRCSPP